MPVRGAPLHLPVAPAGAARAIPGVYLSPRIAAVAIQPLRTGTPAFLGVQGVKRVVRLDSRHDVEGALRQVTGMAAHAVRGFFANGGQCCYLVPARGNESADPGEFDLSGLDQVGDFDLVCAPDMAALLSPDQLARAHARILGWCAHDGLRFAILDAPRTIGELDEYRQSLDRNLRGKPSEVRSFGAGYYPWLRIAQARVPSGNAEAAPGPGGIPQIPVPCSGHVAGIYSRNDRDKGVWVAPANEVVAGALALDNGGSGAGDSWAAASTAGFNALRGFRKRGIRVWGARTLCSDPPLGYVTARRVLQAVARRLEQVLAPIVFEPDTPLLWARVNRIVSAQFEALYRSGALAGATAEEAYFVRCDADTNPPQARARGQVVAEAGIAVVAPAEFITIDIRIGENDLAIFQHVGG